MVLAAGLVVPMAVEYSNKKNQVHMPTVICAYLTFLLALSFRGNHFESCPKLPTKHDSKKSQNAQKQPKREER
jgi:hypothetical protein